MHQLPKNKMNSTAGTHIPPPRCGKHGNSGRKYGSTLFQKGNNLNNNNNTSPVNFRQGSPKTELSARKLAAGLWSLRFLEVSRDGIAPFLYGSSHFPNSDSEEGVKHTDDLSEASNMLAKIQSRKLPRKVIDDDSVVSALLAQLLRAQSCISKLKAQKISSQKKVEQFVKKLEEEKVVWNRQELENIGTMLDELHDKLARERRSRERMEFLNAKLVHELAKANLCVRHHKAEVTAHWFDR